MNHIFLGELVLRIIDGSRIHNHNGNVHQVLCRSYAILKSKESPSHSVSSWERWLIKFKRNFSLHFSNFSIGDTLRRPISTLRRHVS